MNKNDESRPARPCPIAIIGIGCLFPRARNLKEFWRLLRRGEDGITEVPPTHWAVDAYFDVDPKSADRTYCRRGGFLPPTPFDPVEFGIPPTALEATDTAQLLALYAAKQAMQDAGYGDGRAFDRDRVGVILGVTGTLELSLSLGARLGHPIWRAALAESGVAPDVAESVVERIADGYVSWQENSFPGLLGNVVAGRIANRLNLRGTNCVVDAACASSLSALHLAMLELQTGRADMVLTGGVDTLNDIFMYMCFSKTPALSPTGDSRPFAEAADGTVIGEGVGIVMLKRLDDAIRDGDRVYAVIRGLGSSSDGRSQSIYAPYADGQARALRNAYQHADVDPRTIELVEAHGTGTKVGDAVEFEALRTVYREAQSNGAWCGLGSVKSQIGHTKAAAGVAGLIKVALALRNRVLPPTIKVDAPNPKMGISESPFYLNTVARPWLGDRHHPRRAAVSAFGFGGSNFHLVVEESPVAVEQPAWDGSVEIAAFSADTVEALREQIAEFAARIEKAGDDAFAPARAAAESRRQFDRRKPHRVTVVFEAGDDWPRRLNAAVERTTRPAANESQASGICYGNESTPGQIAFLFPGQGSQYVNMGRELACVFPEMRAVLALLDGVSATVFPPPAFDEGAKSKQSAELTRTDRAQPALGALSAGMCRLLARFGIRPDMAGGHSYGELPALRAAGWMDDATLLRLSAARGQAMACADDGAMLAVHAPLAEIERTLREACSDVVVANRNAPNLGVLSGSRGAIDRVAALLKEKGHRVTELAVGGAFHSPMMREASEPFRRALAEATLNPGKLPVYANRGGGVFPAAGDQVRSMLADQLIRPVEFVRQIENMHAAGARTFVEVGPRAVLTGLVGSILGDRSHVAMSVDASAGRQSGLGDLGRLVARLAAMGHQVELAKWEEAVPPAQVRRMTVPIVGANYRAPRVKPVESKAAMKTAEHKASRVQPTSGIAEEAPIAATHPGNKSQSVMNQPSEKPSESSVPPAPVAPSKTSVPSNVLASAMQVVEQGLRAMQTLQQQTAAAHERFLAGQEQAQATFARLIAEQQRLLVDPPGERPRELIVERQGRVAASTAENRSEPQLPAQGLDGGERLSLAGASGSDRQRVFPDQRAPSLQAPGPARHAPGLKPQVSIPTPQASSPAPQAASPQPQASTNPQAPSPSQTDVGAVVLDVVSEKTGYPREMLGLDMDIEADLGIDSIKRVEIIAAVEERAPGLTSVSPEQMGSLRTLRQITAYMSSSLSASGPAFVHVESKDEQVTAVPSARSGEPPLNAEASSEATGELEATLLDTVAQLTGYPREMLELDMDLEADLGIDSIKRVEILAAVEAKSTAFKAVNPEYMGSLRTLRQIVAYSASQSAEMTEPTPPGDRAESPSVTDERVEKETASPKLTPLTRRVLSWRQLPDAMRAPLPIASDGEIWVTDDGPAGLGRSMAAALQARGATARVVEADAFDAPPPTERVCGFIFVDTRRESRRPLPEPAGDEAALSAFQWARALGSTLESAAQRGGAFLMTVARMDGAFGLIGGPFDAASGGLAGIAKTAAREWPAVRCRAIDVATDWDDAEAAAEAVVTELCQQGPIEVGLDRRARRGLRLDEQTMVEPDSPALAEGDVVIVTGGGRGVTADVICEWARRQRVSIVLLGRTPAPTNEPEWLAGLTDEAHIKRRILSRAFPEPHRPTPAELESAYRRCMANREVLATIHRLSETGAGVVYHSVDVRNDAALRSVLGEVRATIGPIRGIVHGAGVIEDRRIADKTPEQFTSVYSTKVAGLRNLIAATEADELRVICLFSSVSARFGNIGQADYAAANEVLNKTAQRLAAQRPNCRVVSINWGPWDGGMVGPALRREFEKRGVQLIPIAAGAAAAVDEMGAKPGAVEVVIGSGWETSEPDGDGDGSSAGQSDLNDAKIVPTALAGVGADARLTVAFERVLDIDRHPFLQSHVLDGKPVLPAAMMMEWMGHAALHANPGLILHGFDDFRILKGVVGKGRVIRPAAGRVRRAEGRFEVDVELRGGATGAGEVVHARAVAVLGSKPARAPSDLDHRADGRDGTVESAWNPSTIYNDVLFHGEHFHAIESVDGVSEAGLDVQLKTAPPPADWMDDPMRSAWICDPLVIDGGYQAAILWCHAHLGAGSLPSYLAVYRQYVAAFPRGRVSCRLDVLERSRSRMRCNLTFANAGGAVIARIEGYECTVDASLRAAFAKNLIAVP